MAKMRILQFSDNHSDHKAEEAFVAYANSRKDIDMVVCTGDILGPCLNGPQASRMHSSLETIANGYGQINSMNDVKKAIEFAKKSSNGILNSAVTEYLELEAKFDKKAEEHYKKFNDTMSKLKTPWVTIPGNWDSEKGYLAALKEKDLHNKYGKLGDETFLGYGGANMHPKFNPLTRTMPYDEKGLAETLEKVKPTIIFSHMSPTEKNGKYNDLSSEALGKYIEKHNPKLVLCGHSHHAKSCKVGKTTVVNPGNLGAYFNHGSSGTFAEIELDGDKVTVTHYQIGENGSVKKYDPKTVKEMSLAA